VLVELQTVFDLIEKLSLDELPHLAGDLEVLRVAILRRLTAPPAQSPPDHLLGVAEAARRLGLSRDFLYRNHKKYSFARRIGRRLLFSAEGIRTWIERGRKCA